MTTLALTPEQLINVILTIVIAVAVIAQAWFTRTQARLLRESERWAREREKPKVRIVGSNRSVARVDRSGVSTTAEFSGFTVTNAGLADIEITSFAFELGRMLQGGEEDYPTAEIEFTPVGRHALVPVSTMSLPHRLRHGESFSVLYDRERLVEESLNIGGETPVHMRPYCHDSLGNKHMLDHWIVYRKDNHTAFVDSPSPGRISEEDWNQLSRAERQLGSRWSRRGVG